MTIRFVDNAGVSLAVETRGSGARSVVFAHGWISGRRMWYDVAERLDAGRFTCHLLDFRGAGLSDRPMEGHDVEGYASDLRAVLDDAGPSTVVAHSMGGKIAQYLAAQAHPNIERLVLIAPGSARAVRLSERHRAQAEEAFGSRVRIERFQRAAMRRALSPEVMERIVDDALVAQREHWFGWYDKGRTQDFTALLGSISVPVVAVAGDGDPLAPASRVRRETVEPIAGALFVTLRNAGHNLPVETPDEVAGVIERFDG